MLYSVFVLFPWFLLLLFLYRKRDGRAAQIIEDLELLDPRGRLLKRGLGLDDTTSLDPMKREQMAALLVGRAFSNFEYVLCLALLTIITAVGWYYFLYPRASLGLAELIRAGGGIVELTTYLTANASPLTFGFAGAYFFATQMLLRRYLSADLYPSAFLQVAERFVRVLILSVVLAVAFPLVGIDSEALAAVAAFLAGIWPREAQQFLTKQINRLLSSTFPEDIQLAPLTDLDGVDLWVETRLLEENIENVQGMATAGIETLVIGTYYPASRLVDWVDQAILYAHCGHKKEWFATLRAAGIRSASDLLDAAGLDMQALDGLAASDFIPTPERLEALAKAVADARAAAAGAAAGPGPGAAPALTAGVLREMCDTIWPDPNVHYVLRYSAEMARRI
jgi:hypothetical protein